MPAKEYVKKKLQEVESGDYRAEELSEVVSRDEVDPDSLLPRWDSKGNLMVRRGSTKAKEQSMRNAYQMVAPRHTNRPELQGEYVKVFEDFKDYLLGEHVFGLYAKDADSMQDRHFTTPLALFAKRPSGVQPPGQGEYGEAKEQRFEAKGGKDKGHEETIPEETRKGSLYGTSGRLGKTKKEWYLGPLPKKAGQPPTPDNSSTTAAAWPPALCEWVAIQILASFGQNSEKGGSQETKSKKRTFEEDEGSENPEKKRAAGSGSRIQTLLTQGREEKAPQDVASGRVPRLKLMGRLLEMAGDKDYEFSLWPRVYMTEKPHYPLAKEHEDHVRQHLEEEVKEGLIDKMSRRAFEEKFGEERAVAAFPVLVEDEAWGGRPDGGDQRGGGQRVITFYTVDEVIARMAQKERTAKALPLLSLYKEIQALKEQRSREKKDGKFGKACQSDMGRAIGEAQKKLVIFRIFKITVITDQKTPIEMTRFAVGRNFLWLKGPEIVGPMKAVAEEMDFQLQLLDDVPEACAVSYDDVQLLADATHPNPKHVLGVQVMGPFVVLRCWVSGAEAVSVINELEIFLPECSDAKEDPPEKVPLLPVYHCPPECPWLFERAFLYTGKEDKSQLQHWNYDISVQCLVSFKVKTPRSGKHCWVSKFIF
ncbi:unnamed protein product [Cladocopium goreaui]|uniref:1,4-alpha-glucan branching enzyme GlgB n=1 Tax=Cladocopium goreaui TaxID=2562237 RepID=A0A9P1CH80_9DINO|nr:unnamed protein product [Cladocopium goreaui]